MRKFKVGDRVRVYRYPANVYCGGNETIREFKNSGEVFTIVDTEYQGQRFASGPLEKIYLRFKEMGWYLSKEDVELVGRTKQIKSWSLK